VKFAAIADWAEHGDYQVKFMCQQLGVSEQGFYAWRRKPPSDKEATDSHLLAVILDAFDRLRGNPGRRRMWAELRSLGYQVSSKRVHRLMKTAGLQGRHPKAWRKTTIRGENPNYAPNLLKGDFTAEKANTRWCGDITYVKTWQGWAYMAAVIDLYSRKAVGWAVADHMRADLVEEALRMAITRQCPSKGVIFHSDKGCQYTSDQMVKFCEDNGIRRSMGRVGTCFDNAVAESFFASYKKELIHTKPWPTLKMLRIETFDWIENYYNRLRRHSTLGYLTPVEYEIGLRSIKQLHTLAA
jgi:transposase InsO family protein